MRLVIHAVLPRLHALLTTSCQAGRRVAGSTAVKISAQPDFEVLCCCSLYSNHAQLCRGLRIAHCQLVSRKATGKASCTGDSARNSLCSGEAKRLTRKMSCRS